MRKLRNKKANNLPKITELKSAKARIQIQAAWLQNPRSITLLNKNDIKIIVMHGSIVYLLLSESSGLSEF